jgi:hypothetical protein
LTYGENTKEPGKQLSEKALANKFVKAQKRFERKGRLAKRHKRYGFGGT